MFVQYVEIKYINRRQNYDLLRTNKNYNVYKHEDLLADFLKQTYNINRVNLTIVKELEIEIHGLIKFQDTNSYGFRLTVCSETTFESLKLKIDKFILDGFTKYREDYYDFR